MTQVDMQLYRHSETTERYDLILDKKRNLHHLCRNERVLGH